MREFESGRERGEGGIKRHTFIYYCHSHVVTPVCRVVCGDFNESAVALQTNPRPGHVSPAVNLARVLSGGVGADIIIAEKSYIGEKEGGGKKYVMRRSILHAYMRCRMHARIERRGE